jgi:hypothetical protein
LGEHGEAPFVGGGGVFVGGNPAVGPMPQPVEQEVVIEFLKKTSLRKINQQLPMKMG